jgi:hypothetical protein
MTDQPITAALVRVTTVDHGSKLVAVSARVLRNVQKVRESCSTHGLQRPAHAPVKNALSSMWRFLRDKASGTENCSAAALYLENTVIFR